MMANKMLSMMDNTRDTQRNKTLQSSHTIVSNAARDTASTAWIGVITRSLLGHVESVVL